MSDLLQPLPESDRDKFIRLFQKTTLAKYVLYLNNLWDPLFPEIISPNHNFAKIGYQIINPNAAKPVLSPTNLLDIRNEEEWPYIVSIHENQYPFLIASTSSGIDFSPKIFRIFPFAEYKKLLGINSVVNPILVHTFHNKANNEFFSIIFKFNELFIEKSEFISNEINRIISAITTIKASKKIDPNTQQANIDKLGTQLVTYLSDNYGINRIDLQLQSLIPGRGHLQTPLQTYTTNLVDKEELAKGIYPEILTLSTPNQN